MISQDYDIYDIEWVALPPPRKEIVCVWGGGVSVSLCVSLGAEIIILLSVDNA